MISRFHRFVGLVVLATMFFTVVAVAQAAPEVPDITKVPAAAQPSDHFDVNAATDAYMDLMPASAKARSDAYFEGGYWLILWDFLLGAVIALLLLNLGWSAAMRNLAERITKWKWLQTFIYWVQYLLLTTRARLSHGGVRRLLPRVEVWAGHADIWPVDVGPGQGSWPQRALGGLIRGGAVCGSAQAAPHLVDLGRGCHRRD